jgi:hypothetical protein
MTRVMRWDNLIKSKQQKKYQSLILNKLNIEKKLRKKSIRKGRNNSSQSS